MNVELADQISLLAVPIYLAKRANIERLRSVDPAEATELLDAAIRDALFIWKRVLAHETDDYFK